MTPISRSAAVAAVPARGPTRTLPHLWIVLFLLASIALFWDPLRQWVSLSLSDPRYSHLILIPLISAFFLYRQRHSILPGGVPSLRLGATILAIALAAYAAVALCPLSPDYALTVRMLEIVLVWAAGFALCYSPKTLKFAAFPLLLLLLVVPLPFGLMDGIVSLLQRGSAWATYALFKLAGVPVFRVGVNFELPGIGIEIAKECSSIHSGWALFITGLLVGHMFLKSMWAKFCLTVFTVPIAMGTNAVRITTLWFLGTHVDVGFLYGNLHHHGGVVFSLISLSVLMGLLGALRKIERRELPASGAGKDHVKLIVPPGGQAASLP